MYQFKIIPLIFGLLFIIVGNVFPQDNYLFNHLTTNQGLSQSEVRAITKDAYGYMWFGTTDGLNKYDGYNFTVYKNNPSDTTSLKKSSIRHLYSDKKGNVWIGTISGLNLYRHSNNTFIHIPIWDSLGKLVEHNINAIKEDSYGNMWLLGQGGNFRLKIKEDKGEYTFHPEQIFGNNGECGEFTSDSGLVLGNYNALIYIPKKSLNKEELLPGDYLYIDSLGNTPITQIAITAILENEDKSLFLGTGEMGIIHYYPPWAFNETKSIVYAEGTPGSELLLSNSITGISRDANGLVWFSTQKGLYNLKQNDKGIEFNRFLHNEYNNESIVHDNVDEIYVDDKGIIWLGTMGGGLSFVDLNRKQFFKNRIPTHNNFEKTNNFIRAIKEDDNGNIFFGTFDKKVAHYNPNTEKFTYIQKEGGDIFTGNQVFDLLPAGKNELYIASIGLGGQIFHLDYADLNDPIITQIGNTGSCFTLQYFNNELWKGSWNNFGKITGIPDSVQYHQYDMKPNNPVRCIAPDPAHNVLWLGTLTRGLVKVIIGNDNIPVAFHHFLTSPSDTSTISDNTVRDIVFTRNGKMYVATDNGLNEVLAHPNDSTIKFKRYFIEDGLPNTRIQGLLQDNLGQVWISTVRGLSCLNPKTSVFKNYDINDGLQNNEFVESSKLLANNGMLYFGNIDGYTYFDPKKIKDNPHTAEPKITNLIINNQYVNVGTVINNETILAKPIYNTKKLKLNWKHRSITFEFSAMHYSAPVKNRFRYKLKGFDDTWQETDASKRSVTYTNLPIGNYTLLINATNNDNVWSNNPIELPIRMKPPFWRTTLFYIVVVVLIAMAIFRFVKFREQQSIKAQKALEDKIKEGEKIINKKVREVEDQKLELRERQQREKELTFLNNGLAHFSDILGRNKNNIEELCSSIIYELVRYVSAEQGALFLLNSHEENPVLNYVSGYGTDDINEIRNSFMVGEGLIGASFNDGRIIYKNEIPEGYISVSSGLGKQTPKYLLIIPIQQDTLKVGVIELSSFHRIGKFKIDFIQKLCENIASVISIENANKKAAELLEENKSQTEEMRAQEEEMRQNIEEMMATQEENQRREQKYIEEINNLKEHIEDLEDKIDQLENP